MSDELAVTLAYGGTRERRFRADVDVIAAQTRDTAERLDRADDRIDRLYARLGKDRPQPTVEPLERPGPPPVASPAWDELVQRARSAVDEPQRLNDLLDPDEVRRIERRIGAAFTANTVLDRYDLAAAVTAGVAGALVDWIVVGTPPTSRLTDVLRSRSIEADNWLAPFAHVPYDQVAGTGISGIAPMTHRVQTFGHDPLLGWAFGVLDILQGSLTGISRGGAVAVQPVGGPVADSVVTAFALQAAHLVSDVATRSGLPLPGWTALLTIDATLPGARHSVAELARWMYVRGYDTWHFLTMATPLAATAAILRGYLAVRQRFDEEYRIDLEVERFRTLASGVSDLPRYQTMRLIAQGITAAGNLGRFALNGANPLTLNYPLWLAFSRSLLVSLDRATPTDTLTGTQRSGRILLDAGWAGLAVEDSSLPPIRVDAPHPPPESVTPATYGGREGA